MQTTIQNSLQKYKAHTVLIPAASWSEVLFLMSDTVQWWLQQRPRFYFSLAIHWHSSYIITSTIPVIYTSVQKLCINESADCSPAAIMTGHCLKWRLYNSHIDMQTHRSYIQHVIVYLYELKGHRAQSRFRFRSIYVYIIPTFNILIKLICTFGCLGYIYIYIYI